MSVTTSSTISKSSSTLSSSPEPFTSTSSSSRVQDVSSLITIPPSLDCPPKIFRVVLTGGPCGGKTTAIAELTERFQGLGYRIWRLPEAATILLQGGVSFYGLTDEQKYQFNLSVLKFMISMEDNFLHLARMSEQKSLVLYDRGCMDVRAYMSESEWQRLMNELHLNTVNLRDSRYDAVIHLVTAADGARQFYTCEGHAVRSEPPEVAAAIDTRIKSNWIGHPYFVVIDNRTDFSGKIARVSQAISKFLGLSNVSVKKRKFLVRNPASTNDVFPSTASNSPHLRPSSLSSASSASLASSASSDSSASESTVPANPCVFQFPNDVIVQTFDVQHSYLLRTDGTQARLRKRGQSGLNSYSYTVRYADLFGQRLELKRSISRREYYDYLLQRDPMRDVILKKRYSFLYQNHYFELDVFQSPHRGLTLVESYLERESDATQLLPTWLDVVAEVTDNPKYSMWTLCARSTPLHQTPNLSAVSAANSSPVILGSSRLSNDLSQIVELPKAVSIALQNSTKVEKTAGNTKCAACGAEMKREEASSEKK